MVQRKYTELGLHAACQPQWLVEVGNLAICGKVLHNHFFLTHSHLLATHTHTLHHSPTPTEVSTHCTHMVSVLGGSIFQNICFVSRLFFLQTRLCYKPFSSYLHKRSTKIDCLILVCRLCEVSIRSGREGCQVGVHRDEREESGPYPRQEASPENLQVPKPAVSLIRWRTVTRGV